MAIHPMRLLSVCAGVGGIDLGIRLAEPAARSVCYVEREAHAAALLVARMEEGWLDQAAIWSDLATFDAGAWRGAVDCVVSGDPCQPNSVAGRGRGADDDRWLLDRVIECFDASGAHRLFRENVPGNADGQLRVLVPALEGLGCRVAVGLFSAKELGFAHGRERLFVMAERPCEQGGIYAGQGRSDEGAPAAGRHGLDVGHASVAVTQGSRLTRSGDRSDELLLTGQALAVSSMWPTPTNPTSGVGQPAEKRRRGGHSVSIYDVAEHWPTPAARDFKGANSAEHVTTNGTGRMHMDQLPNFVEHAFRSSLPAQPIPAGPTSSPERRALNPLFVEWLMGWPIGWTAFEPVETASCRWWPAMRGELSKLVSKPMPAQQTLF